MRGSACRNCGAETAHETRTQATYDRAGAVLQGNGTEVKLSRYDANGQMLQQKAKATNNGADLYTVTFKKPGTSGAPIDAAGNALGYEMAQAGGNTTKYTYTNEAVGDSYRQTRIDGQIGSGTIGKTYNRYDGNGFLVGVDDTIKDVNDRTIVNDASGKVLFIKQAGHIQRQLVVNGEVLGRYGEAVDANQPRNEVGTPVFEQVIDFGFGFTPQGGNTPTVQDRIHTVGAGDTLQSLAQMYYGDSKLWYRVAEANGIAGNQDLRAGQALKIPGTETSGNADRTFKPYDPSEVVGDTSPYVPLPKKKSNFFKQLLVMVVVLVVAYVTHQYYLVQEGIAAVTAAGEVSASALSTEVLASVGTAVPGATGVAGAVGSVAGSFAGQVAGLALGTQDKFSWKQFALSADSASVGYGLNEVSFVGGKLDSFANSALRASIGNTVTQGIGVATGLQRSFDWRGVAASAIGAGVGNAIGAELGLNNRETVAKMGFGEEVGKRLVTGMVAGTMAAVARGGRVAIQQVAVDAFGNALGSSIASSSNSGPATQVVGPWSDSDYVNGADLQSDRAYEARRAEEWIRTSDSIQDRRLYEITAANSQDNFRATERGYRQDLETARQVNGLDLPSDYVLPGPNMTAADWERRAQLIGAGRPAGPSPIAAWAGGAGGGRGFVNPADAVLHNPTAFAGRSTITDPRTYQAQARLTPLDAARAAVGVEKELQALMSTRPNSSEGWATYRSAVGALSERYQTTMRSGGLEPDITLVATMNFQRSIAAYQVDGDMSRMAGTAMATGVVLGMQNVAPGAAGPARTAAGPFSDLVPGGGLAAHEAAGGHLLLKHVGQTESQLTARLAAEPRITGASSFYDRAAAESAVARTIDAKQVEVSSWLAGSSTRLRLDHTLPDPVGISVSRGAIGAVDASSTRIILVRDPSMPTGYKILTGFPQ